MEKYIVGLGEALWDMLPDGKKLGGAPANFAYHAGQFGLNTLAVSALGEDKLADETIEAIEKRNLKYLMPRVPYPTGTVQVIPTRQAYRLTTSRRMSHGTTSHSQRRYKRWQKTAAPYVSVLWHKGTSCHALPYNSLLPALLKTASRSLTSTFVRNSIARKS